MAKVKKILLWTLGSIAVLYVALVIVRVFHFYNLRKTEAEVAKIHATKLTMDDVMGKNLPPDPGPDADKTVAGIDANKNGIRDDVELTIFKEYPNSAKTRAVLLQYAMALQMEMTLPIMNMETFTAVIEDNDTRALHCIWSITPRDDMEKFITETERNENFVKQHQINTQDREKYLHDLYKNLGSYTASGGGCDLDISTLSN